LREACPAIDVANVQVLAKHGTDLHKPWNCGASSSFIAAQVGLPGTVEMGVKHGIDIHKPLDNVASPFYMGAQGEHDGIVEIFAKHAADFHNGTTVVPHHYYALLQAMGLMGLWRRSRSMAQT